MPLPYGADYLRHREIIKMALFITNEIGPKASSNPPRVRFRRKKEKEINMIAWEYHNFPILSIIGAK
jgi:hypothetical protein